MPGISLRLSLRNVGFTRRLLNSPYRHPLNAIHRISHSNSDITASRRSRISHEHCLTPCTVRGYATGRNLSGLLYGSESQRRIQERCVSTQAADHELSSDPSLKSSPVEPVNYPAPYCRLTEIYARENASLPSQDDFPTLPNLLSNPHSSFYSMSQMGLIEIDTDVAKLDALGAAMCKLVCRITPVAGVMAKEPVEVAGLGHNAHSAQNAAYLFLVSALYTRGYLKDVAESLKHLRDTRVHHFDLSDVYHYTSQYAILPEIHHKANPDPNFTSHIQHEVRIELPGQNIQSVAAGPILSTVATEAASSFIAQAKKQDITKNQEQVIDGAMPLTVHIAPDFLRFYLSKCGKSSEIDTRCTRERFGPATVYHGTLYIDGQPVSNPVIADSEKSAKSLAKLAGAVHLVGNNPSLWPEFVEETTEYIPIMHSVSIPMSPETLAAMQTSLESLYYSSPTDQSGTNETRSNDIESLYSDVLAAAEHRAESVDPGFLPFNNRTLEESLRLRNALPARQHSKQILNTINENTVSVIVGSTGSGKTSQIPQMVLEEFPDSNIMVTQPRRVTATTIARRVAFERGEELGHSIGYEIRWDAVKPSSSCGITYRTTGVVLLDLLRGGDTILDTVSHIFVDETHEQDIPTGFLLALLRREINRRTNLSKPIPKIIIMTADPESGPLEKYMGTVSENGESTPATRVVIPNFPNPVHRYFLEDILHSLFSTHSAEDLVPLLSDPSTSQHIAAEKDMITRESSEINETKLAIPDRLLEQAAAEPPIHEKEHFVPLGLTAATIAHIAKTEGDGVILALFPGLDVMKRLEQLLYDRPLGVNFSDDNKFQIFKLHSGLGDIDENVLRPAKKGCRKIILSTNIAENSINIPEVRYVVDSGKKHDSVYDPSTGLRKVVGGWVDKLTINQRQACASQAGNGYYYATFTQSRFDTLAKTNVPRVHLDEIETESLQLRATIPNLPLHGFMRQLPNPPSLDRVNSTIANLESLGAIDQSGDITALGRILSLLPVPLKAGKMVMLGVLLRCFEPALILGAATHARSLFIPSRSERWYNSPRRKFAGDTNSDHISILRAYRKIRQITNRSGEDAAREYCLRHSMSHATYLDMELFISRIALTLRQLNLIPASESDSEEQLRSTVLNENYNNHSVLRALITGTVTPNIAIKPSDSGGQWCTNRFPAAVVSNKSTNSFQKSWAGRMLAFNEALNFHSEADAIMMDTTTIHPLMACLFGGNLTRENSTLFVDSHLAVKVKSPDGTFESDSIAASTVVKMRKLIDKASEDFFKDLASNRNWSEAEAERRSLTTQITDIIDTIPDSLPSRPTIRHIP